MCFTGYEPHLSKEMLASIGDEFVTKKKSLFPNYLGGALQFEEIKE